MLPLIKSFTEPDPTPITPDEFITYIDSILDPDEIAQSANGEIVYILYMDEDQAKALAIHCRRACNTFLPDKISSDPDISATAVRISIPLTKHGSVYKLKYYEIIIVPAVDSGQFLVNIIKSDKEQRIN